MDDTLIERPRRVELESLFARGMDEQWSRYRVGGVGDDTGERGNSKNNIYIKTEVDTVKGSQPSKVAPHRLSITYERAEVCDCGCDCVTSFSSRNGGGCVIFTGALAHDYRGTTEYCRSRRTQLFQLAGLEWVCPSRVPVSGARKLWRE